MTDFHSQLPTHPSAFLGKGVNDFLFFSSFIFLLSSPIFGYHRVLFSGEICTEIHITTCA